MLRPALLLLSGGWLLAAAAAAEAGPARFIALLERNPVIDAVDLSAADPGHRFTQQPAGVSLVETLAGVACRVLPNGPEARYVAVRLGEGRGLVPLATYCLELDLVEDAPRTFYLFNRGDDTLRAVACGAGLSDALWQYTPTNPEVLDVPLAHGIRTWRSIFRLPERLGGLKREPGALTPAEGIWVVIAQPEAKQLPGSSGAAVAAIRLRAIADPTSLTLEIHRPPAELPWRHAFWREEMADGIADPRANGGAFSEPLDFYAGKLQTMRILGYDVLCKDLLEFGHNQGWDSTAHGGDAWFRQAGDPQRWARIVDLAGRAGVAVLPYFEYAGSLGGSASLGPQRRCQTLGGRPAYTEIEWLERANADLTDPETLADFTKVVDCTVLRLKDRARFLGVWLRQRSSANPISFAPAALARFAAASGEAGVTRERLREDPALRQRYCAWWNTARRDFLVGVRDVLRHGGVADATVLYTANATEPAPVIHNEALIVEGDPAPWAVAAGREALPWATAFDDISYLDTTLSFGGTWGGWEWNWAGPPPDPATYSAIDGVAMTYPYRRLYSVATPADLAAFNAPAGLAMIRHQSLNERTIPETLVGYQCVDSERAGPACVLPEVLAVVNGDPRWLGILNAGSLTTGYPQHVRAFYAAYLSLPALPGRLLAGAADHPAVRVRLIDGGRHGTWLAVANTGYTDLAGVGLTLPHAGTLTDAATGELLHSADGGARIDLGACSLRALRLVH